MIPLESNAKRVQTCLFVSVVLVFAFLSGTASAQIKLTDNLSLSGFLDKSVVVEDDGNDKTASLSFDQLEVDFHYNYGSVTARADIDSTGEDGDIILEQGFVTYTFPEDTISGLSITAGRFLSSLGWETAEPTGLFQFSFSEGIPYPAYQNGVAIGISPVKEVGIYAAVLSGAWDVNDTDVEDPGFEAQLSLMPVEQLTAKVGFALDDTGAENKRSELNAWVSFAEGPLTLAGEIDILSNWPSVDATGAAVVRDSGMHFLGMANLSLEDTISAPVGLTVRFSGIDLDEEETSTEITVSPSYTATDNWLLLAEFKRLIDKEVTIFAVESLFTF
jgi:hypothetical protein